MGSGQRPGRRSTYKVARDADLEFQADQITPTPYVVPASHYPGAYGSGETFATWEIVEEKTALEVPCDGLRDTDDAVGGVAGQRTVVLRLTRVDAVAVLDVGGGDDAVVWARGGVENTYGGVVEDLLEVAVAGHDHDVRPSPPGVGREGGFGGSAFQTW